jgi:hypothetical protein
LGGRAGPPSLLLDGSFWLDGGRLALALLLCAQDAAPVLVFGDRHAAFDADTHALFRLGFAREKLPERHESPRSAISRSQGQ